MMSVMPLVFFLEGRTCFMPPRVTRTRTVVMGVLSMMTMFMV